MNFYAEAKVFEGLKVYLGYEYVQRKEYGHQFAAHVGAAGTHFPLAGHIVELQPAVCAAVHDALAAQDHAP